MAITHTLQFEKFLILNYIQNHVLLDLNLLYSENKVFTEKNFDHLRAEDLVESKSEKSTQSIWIFRTKIVIF